LITPESIELVALYHRSRQLQSVTGASFYGPNLNDWPARMLDAFSAIADQEGRVLRLLRQAAAAKAERVDGDGT